MTDTVGEPREFIDTNILLYAYDASERVKQPFAVARLGRLWRDGSGVLSTQVLQEFYSVATTKRHPPMSPAAAREIIEIYRAWPVIVIEPTMIIAASALQEQHRLSFWVALIVQAAASAGAGTLLTEDLQHGATYLDITIVDPFRVDQRQGPSRELPPGDPFRTTAGH